MCVDAPDRSLTATAGMAAITEPTIAASSISSDPRLTQRSKEGIPESAIRAVRTTISRYSVVLAAGGTHTELIFRTISVSPSRRVNRPEATVAGSPRDGRDQILTNMPELSEFDYVGDVSLTRPPR